LLLPRHAHILFFIYHEHFVGSNSILIFASFREDMGEKEKKNIEKC